MLAQSDKCKIELQFCRGFHSTPLRPPTFRQGGLASLGLAWRAKSDKESGGEWDVLPGFSGTLITAMRPVYNCCIYCTAVLLRTLNVYLFSRIQIHGKKSAGEGLLHVSAWRVTPIPTHTVGEE